MKAFFIMLKEKYNEEMLRGVVAKHRETWYALSTIKKDKRYKEYIETINDQKLSGGVNMCETLDFIEKRGIEQGIEQGIERGIKELVETVKELTNSKETAINSLMKRYELTQEVAKEKVELYWME